MSKGLFIVGTGTDIGKTYVTGLILKKLSESGASAGYFKAAMSGNVRDEDGKLIPGDALYVKKTAGISQPLEEMCPYVYENAVSPHLASQIEGNPVRMDCVLEKFREVSEKYEYVIVEGSGGILCPICFDEAKIWLVDVIRSCGLGCALVADAGLGTINQVGLTAYYMKEQGISLKGMIFNRFQPGDMMQEDNRKMCEYLTGVQTIACVRDEDTELDISAETLQALCRREEGAKKCAAGGKHDLVSL